MPPLINFGKIKQAASELLGKFRDDGGHPNVGDDGSIYGRGDEPKAPPIPRYDAVREAQTAAPIRYGDVGLDIKPKITQGMVQNPAIKKGMNPKASGYKGKKTEAVKKEAPAIASPVAPPMESAQDRTYELKNNTGSSVALSSQEIQDAPIGRNGGIATMEGGKTFVLPQRGTEEEAAQQKVMTAYNNTPQPALAPMGGIPAVGSQEEWNANQLQSNAIKAQQDSMSPALKGILGDGLSYAMAAKLYDQSHARQMASGKLAVDQGTLGIAQSKLPYENTKTVAETGNLNSQVSERDLVAPAHAGYLTSVTNENNMDTDTGRAKLKAGIPELEADVLREDAKAKKESGISSKFTRDNTPTKEETIKQQAEERRKTERQKYIADLEGKNKTPLEISRALAMMDADADKNLTIVEGREGVDAVKGGFFTDPVPAIPYSPYRTEPKQRTITHEAYDSKGRRHVKYSDGTEEVLAGLSRRK